MNWFKQKRVLAQLAIGGVGIFIVAAIFVLNILTSLPDPGDIGEIRVSQSTKIYDHTGNTLLYEIYAEERRTIISHEDIPDIMRWATISIEDDAFFSHPAFDWRGIVRAAFVNLIHGDVVQGGSTITQQLAKNTFLSGERTLTRKLKELILAIRLEQWYTKDEILNLYLNQVPYGSSAYGIESASITYFGKQAKYLTLAEATLLAALPQAPTFFSPWGKHTDKLEERRLFILERMKDLEYIDSAQKRAAKEPPKVLPRPKTGIKAPHFVMKIQSYLIEKYGEDVLRDSGLRVITTLNIDMQTIAEETVRNVVERNSKLHRGENGALIAIDPQTGHILAMVGSRDYFSEPKPYGCSPGVNCRFEGKFNITTQALRQPGSALKPFVYLSAFEDGLTPETILWDVQTEFNASCPAVVGFLSKNPNCYNPRNFDGMFRGPITIEDALAQSINIPAVKALHLVGLRNAIKDMPRVGINTLDDPDRLGLSLALGGGEVRLIELTSAYATLGADGIYHKPVMILKIKDANGKIIKKHESAGKRVFNSQYIRLINDILSDVELRSPLFRRNLGLTQIHGRQVAIKTGTTDNFVDAWAFGYAPNLAVGIWVGNNNGDPLSYGTGASTAIPMWHEFMSQALPKLPVMTFKKPGPIFTDNPSLRGELIDGSFRSILYHLQRKNDSQFNHWETGVSLWLKTNTVDTNKFPVVNYDIIKNNDSEVVGEINIHIISPKSGSFVDDPFLLSFIAESARNIEKIEIYLNNSLIESRVNQLGVEVLYKSEFDLDPLFELQNLLVVRVTDSGGLQKEKSLIIYR